MGRRRVWIALAVAAVVAAGLAWFQPWTAFIDTTVDDPLPAAALDVSAAPAADVTGPATSITAPTATSGPTATPSPRTASVLLARGTLITHEHDTSGRVSIVRQPDGSRVLALAGLDTSDGPDVRVWLTDQRVRRGEAGWYVFDDGRYVDLGQLKGNRGNQVYRIPTGVDLSRFRSVSLWCNRFDVSFGAAALTRVA